MYQSTSSDITDTILKQNAKISYQAKEIEAQAALIQKQAAEIQAFAAKVEDLTRQLAAGVEYAKSLEAAVYNMTQQIAAFKTPTFLQKLGGFFKK